MFSQGTYNPSSATPSIDFCQLCDAGFYCRKAGLNATEGKCYAGYFCKEGSPSPTPVSGLRFYLCIPPFMKKLFLSLKVILIDLKGISNHNFLFQNNGSLSNITYGGICPRGYYCPVGTKRPFEYPCPNGTYSNTPGLEREEQCIPCDPGRSCTGEGLREPNGVCRPGWYCLRGATTPMPLDSVTGNICPAGFQCPNGTANFTECEPGTYR